MQIQDINPVYRYHGPESTQTTSLSDQMVRAMDETDAPDPVEAPDDSTSAIPYFFEDIYGWLMQNINTGKLELMDALIAKLRDLKTEDGSKSYYNNFTEMQSMVTLLTQRMAEDGVDYGSLMNDLSIRLFGLGMFMENISRSAFFPDDDIWGKPGEW
jgi:hypothetical protein